MALSRSRRREIEQDLTNLIDVLNRRGWHDIGLSLDEVLASANRDAEQLGIGPIQNLYMPHQTVHAAPGIARRYGETDEDSPVVDMAAVRTAMEQQRGGDMGPGYNANVQVPLAAPSARDRAMDLQRRLNAMGAGLVVDGIIGPKTRAAMQRYGLDANGNPAPGGPAPGPGPGGGPAAPAAASAGSVEDQVRQKYGYLAWALDLPEIGDILRRAATEGWDDARVRGAVEGTTWWKNSSASMRQWQQQQAEDSATANGRIQAQVDYIRSQSGIFGITIDPNRATAIATDSLKYGWSGTQLQSAILNEFHYVKGQTAGRSAQIEQQLRALAGDYFVPIDDGTIGTWVEQAVKQQQEPDAFKHYLVDQAKGLFPGLAKMLDQGLTTRQVASPYQNLAAGELGVAPDEIDFRDPKWGRALTVMDKDGARPMTLYEWQRTIRGDDVYGFKQSAKGKALAADGVLTLVKALGRAAA